MAFGIGINTQEPDQGPIRGKQESVACGCWFTSKGNTCPKLIKYQDTDGNIKQISNISVRYTKRENFCGIPTVVYACSASEEGQEYYFKLLFYPEECSFKIIWQK